MAKKQNNPKKQENGIMISQGNTWFCIVHDTKWWT